MSLTSRSLVAAAVLAAFGLAAQAQTPPAPPASGMPPAPMQHRPMMMDHGQMHEQHMQQRHQRRMDGLKRILQLTPQQDAAFNNWAAAMRPAANMQRPDRDAFARMTTPERIDRLKQLRAQRSAEQDRRADATKAFYAQLTAPQQKAFDEVSLRFLAKRGGRHGGRPH